MITKAKYGEYVLLSNDGTDENSTKAWLWRTRSTSIWKEKHEIVRTPTLNILFMLLTNERIEHEI